MIIVMYDLHIFLRNKEESSAYPERDATRHRLQTTPRPDFEPAPRFEMMHDLQKQRSVERPRPWLRS
jgi:hypothetical protein